MEIFEIVKPGVWLNSFGYKDNWEIGNLLSHLIDSFYEANLALNLFNQERINSQHRRQIEVSDWHIDSSIKQEIRERIEAKLSFEERFNNFEEIHFQTEREFKIQSWSKGNLPSSFSSNLGFIYARTFLFALDNFEKIFEVLIKKYPIPQEASILFDSFKKAFPELKDVRDSAHHQEDRVRGLKKWEKKIDSKPIKNDMIDAPNGALILNCLNNNKYGYTLADGNYGEVEVSVASLEKLQGILQNLLNIFEWKGPKEHLPR